MDERCWIWIEYNNLIKLNIVIILNSSSTFYIPILPKKSFGPWLGELLRLLVWMAVDHGGQSHCRVHNFILRKKLSGTNDIRSWIAQKIAQNNCTNHHLQPSSHLDSIINFSSLRNETWKLAWILLPRYDLFCFWKNIQTSSSDKTFGIK